MEYLTGGERIVPHLPSGGVTFSFVASGWPAAAPTALRYHPEFVDCDYCGSMMPIRQLRCNSCGAPSSVKRFSR